jgi:hypothetical protein
MAATIPIRPLPAAGQRPTREHATGAFEYLSTKKDELVGWARKFSLFPYPFVTAMALAGSRPSSSMCSPTGS